MKNRNLLGITFVLVLLAVVVGSWLAPQATAIGPKQEEYVGSLGILIDESVRTTIVNPGDPASGTDQAEVTLTISDLANNTIFQSTVPVGPGGFEYPDLNANQLSQVSFDSSGRAQLIVEIFNLLENDNAYADPRTQAILDSPNFRVNNQTLGPRLAQVGVRLDF